MKLSIITINRNNAAGLRRTMESVLAQTYDYVEHVIIDGDSSDDSVDAIKEYVRQVESGKWKVESVIWISEKDDGIYQAMNKGIRRATGDYIQILNSGDVLAAPDVTERMVDALRRANAERLSELANERVSDESGSSTLHNQHSTTGIPILYGNMIKKDYKTGRIVAKSTEVEYSLRQYYRSTMNHDCCYIRRDLFDQYGLYDESLKIVSDWKWFLQVIGLGNVKPVYTDIDVTIFDCSGISETNLELRNSERHQVLAELLPPAVLADYNKHAFEIEQVTRLKRYHMYGLVFLVERIMFKFEKWKFLPSK